MTRPRQEYAPVQERGEATKNRLLDQALELFSRKGYHATTSKEIAAAAGLATGSFYRYFRDKKAVFLGVCSRLESGMQADIFGLGLRLRAQGCSPRRLLETVVNKALQAHEPHRRFHLEVMTLQARDPDVAALVRERRERITRQLQDFLRPMQSDLRVADLKTAAALVHMTVEEAAFQTVILQEHHTSQALRIECVDMLARYLLQDPEPSQEG